MNALDRDLAARDEEAAQLQVPSPLCLQTNKHTECACRGRVQGGSPRHAIHCDHHLGLCSSHYSTEVPNMTRRC